MTALGYQRINSQHDLARFGEGQLPGSQRPDDADDAERAPIVPLRCHIKDLVRSMGNNGWVMIPEVLGEVAGFNVYTAVSPSGTLCLHNAPQDFKHLQRVKSTDARFEGFLSRLQAEINNRFMIVEDKFEIKAWANIARSFIDRPTDNRSDVALVAAGMQKERYELRTLTGVGKTANKYVPPLSWFPETLQQLDVPELFRTFLPTAETKALMMMLGKMLTGNKGTKTAEGTIPNTYFAGEAVLIGFDGGEGKSTLMNTFIGNTLELLGYKRATIKPSKRPFDDLWAVTADYGYCDELTKESHQRLLGDWALVKSVVTGEDNIYVEAKGVQGWEASPTAQPFFSSNHFSHTDLMSADGGSLRRYYPLQCYGKEESAILFGADWKNTRLPQLWQDLAEELEVTVECITARVLRYSLDLYLETTGISITDAFIRHDRKANRLEEVMTDLKQAFRISVDMGHGKRLLDAIEAVTIGAIATMDNRFQGKVKVMLADIPIMPKALHTVIEIWRAGEAVPEELKAMYLDDISPSVRLTWDAQADSLHNDCLTLKNPAKVFERIIETLTVKGKEWGFQKSISSYAAGWNTKLAVIGNKLDNLPSEAISQLPDSTYQQLKELGEQMLIALNITQPPRRR